MLNFRNIGCKIGEDTLNVRLRMLKNKKDNEDKVKQKKDNVLLEQKQKYNKIQSEIKEKNIPIGSLSISQLKILCTYKKKPDDKVSISKMKRNELLSLWTQWMHRNDVGIRSSITINHIAKKQRNDEVLDCMEPVYRYQYNTISMMEFVRQVQLVSTKLMMMKIMIFLIRPNKK